MSPAASPRLHDRALDPLLSEEGWVHASMPSVGPDDPGRFHALFGRDSLVTALQVLPRRPEVAVATLRALAARQGRLHDPETEEQPGRILHEDRPVAPDWLVEAGWPVREGALRYYGTSDATSWWLVVLDAVGDPALVEELADGVAAAARWLEQALLAGDGLVRCGPRERPGGLSQQGWRDARDPQVDEHGGGIVREDGSAPTAPMADADSQAVTVAALDALGRLDPGRAGHWGDLAAPLRARIEVAFVPEVMALEADDLPVVGAGSQLGWLLWADALSPEGTARVARRLTRPDVLTAYGVRTLASSHPAFLVEGYHRGAIWPFDSWLCWGGLRRAGYDDAAEQVRDGVRRAVGILGRYPELYAVTPDGRLRDIPIANRVQAWTVGAMIAFDADWPGRVSR
jgi:glycogen debranching enzyme